MTDAVQPRYRRRVPCRMHLGERNYAGVVLNLSGTGLFVQTSASAQPGDPIELMLGGGIPVTGDVVWRRKVAPMLRSVAEGGVGVRIRNAPEAYYTLLATAASNQAGAPARPQETRSTAPAGPATQPVATQRRPAPPAPDPSPPTRCFRARLKARQGPRSRTLEIDAVSTLEAERKALTEAGVGWVLLDLEERT
jgi:hypothetical protein